jgi:ribonucleoside-diphosphate reductase beta chain
VQAFRCPLRSVPVVQLRELTEQGDPGTLAENDHAAGVTLFGPRELYALWEHQQWRTDTIDLTVDRRDWREMSDERRQWLIWDLAQFAVGEERVATAFAPFVAAAESLDEQAFLATQLADEVRHTVFFDRYYREVVGLPGDRTEDRFAAARSDVNDDFVTMFDERLMDLVDRLRADPSNSSLMVEGVTLYHIVLEGTLALTGQHFIIDYLTRDSLLPGFVEGFSNIARDEHRHLAFGSWYLQRKVREDARNVEIVQRALGEYLPLAAGVLLPPGVAPGEDVVIFGYSTQEMNAFAFTSLARRLKAIGVELPGMAPA